MSAITHKQVVRENIIALHDGNKSYQEIQDVLHLLYPDDDFHSIDVN